MANHQRGIQTVELAGEILKLVCGSPKALSLSEIAESMQLAPGSAYKYLVSLLRTGLLKRNERTLEFEAGPLSLRMGLAKIRHNKMLHAAQEALTALGEQYQVNVFSSVWSAQNGPTVVFYKQAGGFFHIGFRLGIRLSLDRTASGRIFASYLEPKLINDYCQRQENLTVSVLEQPELKKIFESIRQKQYSYLTDMPTPGIQSFAVPVFDEAGQLALCITAFSKTDGLSDEQQQGITFGLQQIARNLKEQQHG